MGIRIEMAVFVSSLIPKYVATAKQMLEGFLYFKATTKCCIISKTETEEAFPTQDQRTLPC